MNQKTQVRSMQAAVVIFAGTIGTVYFPLAAILVPLVGTSSWLVVLLAFLVATPWMLLATWLANQAPSGNFGRAAAVWLGPVMSKLFLFWFGTYWLLLASGIVAEVSFVFHNIALPATPIGVLKMALLLLVIYTDLHGIETCLRTIQALLLVVLPLTLSFLITALSASNWSNLLPILDTGLLDIAKASYLISSYPVGAVLLTLFLCVKVQDRKQVTAYSLLAVGLAGLSLSIVVAVTIAVLGCCVTKSYLYPVIPLAQSITVGQTLVGVDVLVYPMWLLSGYIKSALAFSIASSTARAILPMVKQPWRTLGLGAIAIAIIMSLGNLGSTNRFISMNDFYLAVPFYLVLPAIAFWVKIRKRGQSHAQ